VTTMLRLMHAAMSLAVAVRATGQLTPDVSVPAEVFDQTLKLYQITREAMQHGQGREFANAKDFEVIANLVNAAPAMGSVNDLLSSLDLAPFSSNLQSHSIDDSQSEHRLLFTFFLPPPAAKRERFGRHRDALMHRYINVKTLVRCCYRCHRFSLLAHPGMQDSIVDSLWARSCPCGGSWYSPMH